MHIMLDLETLATSPRAVILSVGAVAFDPNGGELGNKFYAELSVKEQVANYGREIDYSTLQWWMQQKPEAQKLLTSDQVQPTDAVLQAFFDWFVHHNGKQMWGNGADFDCVLLGELYNAAAINKPWSYSQNRCFRTMKSLAVHTLEPAREGVHHNALDDALHQAKWLQRIVDAHGLKL